ncbi:AAA family ATPase [Clavibacter phaseoli]|uniref:AAA family ATPase n=1 Tax=Clavibacter phaseoli TaxID=1734031 RepID=UPI000E672D58|nr:AAA family ATPase [Clavibacter phaseoli]RIJ56607.1 adenylyl-sulfate kinase [Clavibacter phaseoli]UKF31681.1 adenylyl-sulfate kinase [Clavibacter phaseoli]UKF37601.1 adenylyl-sulfate kinase [Clavibacter phaseoli]
MTDAVILTGTVGAGKTTTMHALGALLAERGVPHALVDMDAVRLLHPANPADPFQQELALRNLGDLSRNYRQAGARVVVVATVVERAGDLPRHVAALGSHEPLLVRLAVDADIVRARLDARHRDDAAALAWHRARAPELAAIIDAADLGGVAIDTTSRTPAEVATLVAERIGW